MIAVAIFLVAVAAFCVSAVAGGGAGLVLVPLLRLLLPMEQVPAALSIGTATGSAARIHAFRSAIRWDVVRWFVPAALPTAAMGAWALSRFEPAYVELLIGLFLLANLPALLSRRTIAVADRPAERGRLLLLGAAAGLISGFTGAVGLLFNRAYQRMGLGKEETVATRAANEVLVHLLKIAIYGALGLIDGATLATGVMVSAAAVVAARTMRRVLPLVNETTFRLLSDLAMVAAGAAMFLMSSGQVLAIHRTWVSAVSLGGDREFQLYWAGQRRFTLEWEGDGSPALERRVDRSDLDDRFAPALARLEMTGSIILVEEVIGWRGRYVEVYVRTPSGLVKNELR